MKTAAKLVVSMLWLVVIGFAYSLCFRLMNVPSTMIAFIGLVLAAIVFLGSLLSIRQLLKWLGWAQSSSQREGNHGVGQ